LEGSTGGGGLVFVQPVHGRPDHRDVPVPDRVGTVAGVRHHARDQFRARLVLHARRLSRLAGGAVAAPRRARLLDRRARRRARRRPARRGSRAAVLPHALRPRGALSASVHLCAGPDPRRRRQVSLGGRPAFGVGAAGLERQRPAVRHDPAALQPVHHRHRPGDRLCRLAGAEPHRGRAYGARRLDGPRDARCARQQCRDDLHRHVRRQLVPRRAVGGAGDADPEHRAGDGRADHRPGLYRRRHRRHGLGVGHLLGLGDLRPGPVVRHPDLSRLLAVLGIRLDGGDIDRAAVGPVRKASQMTLRRLPWTLILFLAAVAVPWFGSRYDTFLAEQIAIDALFAVSLNLLLGTTGLVSFGHVAYFGVGAYLCGILMKTYEVPFVLAFPAAGLGSALFALVSGYFCVRLIKLYFAMLTLAFSQIVWAICYKWNDVTGGDQGLPEIPFPNLDWMNSLPGLGDLRTSDQFYILAVAIIAVSLAILHRVVRSPISEIPFPNLDWMNSLPGLGDLRTSDQFYILAVAIIAVSLAILHRVVRSPFGRVLTTIRDNPERAAFIGVNVRAYQLAAFVVAGAFAGFAGALYGIFSRGVFADYVFWAKSAEVMIMAILGGMGYFWGPPVGAAALVWLNQIITDYTQYWPFVLGTILLVLLFGFPGGIVGGIDLLWTRLRSRRRA